MHGSLARHYSHLLGGEDGGQPDCNLAEVGHRLAGRGLAHAGRVIAGQVHIGEAGQARKQPGGFVDARHCHQGPVCVDDALELGLGAAISSAEELRVTRWDAETATGSTETTDRALQLAP